MLRASGFGKRTHLEEFRIQNRGGKGIILIDASERNGPVVDIKLVNDGDEVMLITDRGQTLRTRVDEIRETGRNAQGVRIMNVDEGERVVAVERLAEAPVDEGVDGGSEAPPGGRSAPSSEPPPSDENGAGGSDVESSRGAMAPAEVRATLARLQSIPSRRALRARSTRARSSSSSRRCSRRRRRTCR